MAFLIEGESRDLEGRYRQIKALSARVQRETSRLDTNTANGPISAYDIAVYGQDLTANAVADGLVAYVQDEVRDPAYDVVAEYTTFRAAMLAVTTYLDGALAPVTLVAFVGGSIVPTALTTVQTAPLRTELQALLATLATPL